VGHARETDVYDCAHEKVEDTLVYKTIAMEGSNTL